jgi:hypothetical protein
MRFVMIVAGADMLMFGRRRFGRSLSLVHFALLDERHGPEELHNRNHDTDNQAGKGGRKNYRSKDWHPWSVAGKRIGMADIMGRVVNGANMREADRTDNEKAKGHRQNSLNNYS